jgi:hypothetical protein
MMGSVGWGYWAMAAQLVHDVGKRGRVGQLQVARARQVNFAAHHKTARALAHDVHRVGQKDALAQVVRDKDDVEALLSPQVAQDAPQLFAGKGVQGAKGLVEQQHFGLVDERAANAGALLHAARKLPRKLVFIATQAHLLQQFAGAFFVFLALGFEVAAVGLHNFQRQQHVVHRGAPGQQAGRLKGHATDLERPRHRLAVNAHLAHAGHAQAGGQFHKGGLTAARRPDDGNELARAQLQVDGLHRKLVLLQQMVVVGQPDIAEIHKPVVGGCMHGI